MKILRMLIVGHSHMVGLANAYREAPAKTEEAEPRVSATFVQLREAEYAPDHGSLPETPGFFPAATRRLLCDPQIDLVVSCVGGNDHIVFGLLEHPRRFEVVIPEAPELPLDTSREIVPCSLLRQVLARQMSQNLVVLRALRYHASAPIVHVESPPPVPSAEHIRKYPGIFSEKIREFGIAPATIRYKLWRLHSSIVRKTCEELSDTSFLPIPPLVQDEHGMMVEQGWNPDPTHGNSWYGSQVIAQLWSVAASLAAGRGLPA